MTNQEQRIKLARAMGAKCVDGIWHWKDSTWDSLIFDPENNANDCEALIRHMNSLGWDVSIYMFCSERATVKVGSNRVPPMIWRGNDWKQGVCELALKVIDNE